jgi:hypothetical protein
MDFFLQSRNPFDEKLSEFFGVQRRKHATKGVVAGNAMRQRQKALEPLLSSFPKYLYSHPIICSADDGTNRDDNDLM